MAHLSTKIKSDITHLLEKTSDSAIRIFMISISPRYQKTGLLEEQGKWIVSVWEDIVDSHDFIAGSRASWDTLVFYANLEHAESALNIIKNTLHKFKQDDLKSLCVMADSKGNPSEKIQLLDQMQLETTSQDNYGTIKSISKRIVDGQEA